MTRSSQSREFDSYAHEYRQRLRHPIRDCFAPGGEFFHRRKLDLLREHFARLGVSTNQLHWLDVGCGQGDLLRAGRSCFQQALGCDLSSEMLATCSDLDVHPQSNPREIPFPDNQFDLVTIVCVLHHAPPETRCALVAEARRVLHPRGWLCVIEHNPRNPVTRLIVHSSPIDRGAQLLRAEEVVAMVSAAGYARPEIYNFLYLPEWLYGGLGPVERLLRRAAWGGQYAVFARS